MGIKEIILNKIQKSVAPPFLFIGSGFSRRYIGTPNWEDLLRHFSSLAGENEYSYNMYHDLASRTENTNGIEPKIAELIESDFNLKWYKEEKYLENRDRSSRFIKDGCSPLKIEIADYFFRASSNKIIEGKENEIELLRKIGDRSLGGIITTNYDMLIEKIFSNYKYDVLVGQDELIFSPLTGISEIYKIHGCCSKPKSIVINDKDYDMFNKRNAYLIAKLLTIFLEHPIIFIGYSIGDANIREILSSISDCLPKEKLDLLKERFIFIEWNNTEESDDVTTYEFSNSDSEKSIKMTKVFVNDFSHVYEALLENKVEYNPRLIKKMKEDIYKLVLSTEPSETLKVLVDIDDDKLDEIQTVVGFGIMEKLNIKGYESITAEDLFEDVMYNNKNYDFNLIVEKSIPLILKYNSSIPVYRYISRYAKELPEKLKPLSNKKYKDLLTRTINKKQSNREGLNCSIEDLKNKYGLLGAIKYVPEIYRKHIDLEKLNYFIKEIMTEYPDLLRGKDCVNKSGLKKLIKLYDYLKYKKED
jgi:hypothetical protein